MGRGRELRLHVQRPGFDRLGLRPLGLQCRGSRGQVGRRAVSAGAGVVVAASVAAMGAATGAGDSAACTAGAASALGELRGLRLHHAADARDHAVAGPGQVGFALVVAPLAHAAPRQPQRKQPNTTASGKGQLAQVFGARLLECDVHLVP